MCSSNTAFAIGTRPGCATHVPSQPSVTSRSLSWRTFSSAASFAAGSFLIGICADMPPMAGAPRRWKGFTTSIPQARLEMRLHLRQIEVRTLAARQQLLRVVEEEQREVEDAAGD